MSITFTGEFKASGRPAEVMSRFVDVERMARCMPGASLEGRDEEGNYLGSITVSFGPKKIKFNGKMKCDFDIENTSGTITGRALSDLRGSRASLATRFRIEAASEDELSSIVMISSEADIHGILAEFAKAGGQAVAKALMQEFAERLEQEFSGEDAPMPSGNAGTMSGTKLLWQAIWKR